MHILISLLLIPFILFLVLALFALIFAVSWVRGMWYRLTGRQPSRGNNPFSSYNNTRANSYSNTRANDYYNAREEDTFGSSNAKSETRTTSASSQQKIFSKDDGEYVDFEIVE